MLSKKKLWQAQLVFWPDSVRLTVKETLKWCEEGIDTDEIFGRITAERMSRYMQVSSALQFPNVVFYQIKGTKYRGFRYGVNGGEYCSLYSNC